MFAGKAEVGVNCQSENTILVRVSDRGPGIDPARLQDVMEPFVRLESSRSRETGGTGVGLAIARRIAQANDAKLCLLNREGGGLTAELSLTARR
ncbi:hypothetical protein RLEG12_07990 (plasmid) [Rhizobium leguminosarum bv. trifolii CB782]|nr:hypothetical protein RLEG12_07990 [Rhizobium leguminosarum bv. trifolii CB782]